jgi:hypothetical protein
MDKFWEYVAYLDKPAQWFATAIAWAPKTSLVIAVILGVLAFV